MKILYILIACLFSGIAYRLGGTSKGTKWRDLGCPLVLIGLLLLNGYIKLTVVNLIALFLTFGLSFGALTTYYDWLFGYDNYYAHGLGCGLAGIPLIWAGVPLWLILTRTMVCTVGMGLWSKYTKNDVVEEIGRGVFFIL